jgi:HSP20 family molecular chaperone IbpA
MLRAILPGVTEKDVQVTIQNGRLVVASVKRQKAGVKKPGPGPHLGL